MAFTFPSISLKKVKKTLLLTVKGIVFFEF